MSIFGDVMRACGNPKADASAIAAWGALGGDSLNLSEIKVGLFGYDITCLAKFCALNDVDSIYYCGLIEARGLDGLAFGVQFKIETGSTEQYCAGFHFEESTDVAVCGKYDSLNVELPIENLYFSQNYTVTGTYFDVGSEKYYYSSDADAENGFYGLHSSLFASTPKDLLLTDDFIYRSAFRFIGAGENGGNRWNAGDTIDLFYLDFENEKVTENEGFELLGAATMTLTAVGIALFSAVLM